MFSLMLTILMALKALHIERSTLLHSPARVHILSMVVMPLGQGRVWLCQQESLARRGTLFALNHRRLQAVGQSA